MRSESLLAQAIAHCLLMTSGGSNQESESAIVLYQITEWLGTQLSMQQTQPTRLVNIHLWLGMYHMRALSTTHAVAHNRQGVGPWLASGWLVNRCARMELLK